MAEGAGHNLVLSTYLAFGVFGVLPLLVFEWRFLKFMLQSPRRSVQVAALFSLVAINHQVPWMLYYPLGAIWVVTLGHAARFAAVQQRPIPIEADAGEDSVGTRNMCGIAGVFRRGAVRGPMDAALLERMSSRLAHRGPDGQGIYVDPTATVGLVHRRLAIVDLSDTASQPMSDATGRIRVSYNGEIYNHQVLRAELVQAGYQFKTDHSDTEVLVHGYAHWGLDGLVSRLAGMFALSLWDAKTRELWLVRDRVGIKPLYFTQARQDIVFASEIKALLEHPGVSRQISRAAVSHYLSFWQTPAPLTMFEGIYKIPAGHRVRITQEHGVEMSRYWDVTSRCAEIPGDIERWPEAAQETFYVDGVLKRLRHSVGEHMMSDVPVRRLPVGRRRLEHQRGADARVHGPPDQHLHGGVLRPYAPERARRSA